MRGFPVADWDKFTIGMLLNYAHAYDNLRKKAKGIEVVDNDERYSQLKAIEPEVDEQYKKGKISKVKYESYKKSIERYEKEL